MLPLGERAGGDETDPELPGTVIMPLFIVALAVAMVCSLYVVQTGMFKISS
jgi:hypothetical protein